MSVLSFNFLIKALSNPQNKEIPPIACIIFAYFSISKPSGKYAGLTQEGEAEVEERRVRWLHLESKSC